MLSLFSALAAFCHFLEALHIFLSTGDKAFSHKGPHDLHEQSFECKLGLHHPKRSIFSLFDNIFLITLSAKLVR